MSKTAKIIGLYNQKGGTGKTTTSINISSFLEEDGYNVLGIDADPQGNFTNLMLDVNEFDRSSPENTYLSDIILNKDTSIENAIHHVTFKLKAKSKPKRVHIDLIPSASLEKSKLFDSPYLLRDRLYEVKDSYDYIIIDMPPERPFADTDNNQYNISVLVLCCANEILVPCTTDEGSLNGFFSLSEHISILKQNGMSPSLTTVSFFVNAYSGYKAEQDFLDFCTTLPAFSGVCIPQSGLVKTSQLINRPLAWFNNGSNVAQAYKQLAEYITKKAK